MNLFEKDESGVWCESHDGLYARKENKGVAPNCPRLGRRSLPQWKRETRGSLEKMFREMSSGRYSMINFTYS